MTLSKELEGMIKRCWNSKHMIVFQIVMLQRESRVKKAKDICTLLSHWMDLWKQGEHQGLVKHAIR